MLKQLKRKLKLRNSLFLLHKMAEESILYQDGRRKKIVTLKEVLLIGNK